MNKQNYLLEETGVDISRKNKVQVGIIINLSPWPCVILLKPAHNKKTPGRRRPQYAPSLHLVIAHVSVLFPTPRNKNKVSPRLLYANIIPKFNSGFQRSAHLTMSFFFGLACSLCNINHRKKLVDLVISIC